MNKAVDYTTYLSGAPINPRRIVKPGADADHIVQASAVGDGLIGVSDEVGVEAADKQVDVAFAGIVEVELGGNVAAGDHLTSDAEGKAVAAAPAAGDNVRTIGVALVGGVAGDYGSVLLKQSQVQG